MARHSWLLGLTACLGLSSMASADMIGPSRFTPPPRFTPPLIQYQVDTINFRLFTTKDLSGYTIFACRTDKAPESITLSSDASVSIGGGKGISVWFAAVDKSQIEKLGGEEKILKTIAAKKSLDGVLYSNTLTGYLVTTRGTGTALTENYDLSIDKKIILKAISDAQAKKLSKGSGSSKQIIWLDSPDQGDLGEPPFWTWQRIQLILAGLLLSSAAVFAGIRLTRRSPTIAPAPATAV